MKKVMSFRERLKHNRKKLIVFICTGNTCRSPMAASYLKKLIEDAKPDRDIDVRSAGVMTIAGLLASPEAIQVMENHGVDLRRHRSAQLTPELIRKADIILAMSPFHMQTALRMSDDARDKTFLLKEYTRSDLKNVQIADPMGCTLEVFKKTFKEIKSACDVLVGMEFITGKLPQPRQTAKKASTKKAVAKGGAKAKSGSAKKTAKKAPAKKSVKKSAPKGVPKNSAKGSSKGK